MDLSVEESATRGTRWVCPNDRHLALRAKLRTGWSVKTGSLDSRWGGYPGSNSYSGGANRCGQSFVLSEEERHTIIQVIQRAEALDLSEQERVGRLVERLENMKRNVCIVTTMRSNERRSCGRRCSGGARCVCACALCGEKFGAVLGASPSLCKDCRKYICQKCGIETSTPPNIGLNESKLVIEPERSTAVQRIVRRSAGNAHKQFLCRICAETREMWKKSGAWFFKGMPKYILPEKKERGWTRSGHRTSAWTISTCKSLDTSEPQDSSSDEDATRRLAVARGQSVSTTSLQGTRDNNQPRTPSIASTPSVSPKSPRGRSNNGLSPPSQKEEAGTPSERLVRSSLSIPTQCNRLSPSNSIVTIRSRSGGRSPNGSAIEQKVSFEETTTGDEKATDADVDEEYDDENTHRELSATDRSKGSQTGLVNNDANVNHADQHAGSPTTVHGSCPGKKREFKQGSGTGGSPPQTSQQPDRHSTIAHPGLSQSVTDRNGAGLWDSRGILAIRPSGSVPPVQSGTSTGIKTYGHPRLVRPILQAQHTARRESRDNSSPQNKDGSQNVQPGIQRDPKLLRHHGERYERQSIAHPDSPGRPSGPGLLRRSEISSARLASLPDKTLQCATARPLPCGERRRNVGCAHERPRTDSDHSKLLYTSSGSPNYSTSCHESPAHGQQRVF